MDNISVLHLLTKIKKMNGHVEIHALKEGAKDTFIRSMIVKLAMKCVKDPTNKHTSIVTSIPKLIQSIINREMHNDKSFIMEQIDPDGIWYKRIAYLPVKDEEDEEENVDGYYREAVDWNSTIKVHENTDTITRLSMRDRINPYTDPDLVLHFNRDILTRPEYAPANCVIIHCDMIGMDYIPSLNCHAVLCSNIIKNPDTKVHFIIRESRIRYIAAQAEMIKENDIVQILQKILADMHLSEDELLEIEEQKQIQQREADLAKNKEEEEEEEEE